MAHAAKERTAEPKKTPEQTVIRTEQTVNQGANSGADAVVSIGVNPTFKVIFTPLEYVPIIPPLSSYVINICLYLAKTQKNDFKS